MVGPDLTKIGAIRSGRDLIESIVRPSSTFAQGYESYSLTLKDGSEADGIMARQTQISWSCAARVERNVSFAAGNFRDEAEDCPSCPKGGWHYVSGGIQDLLAFLRPEIGFRPSSQLNMLQLSGGRDCRQVAEVIESCGRSLLL
jgi:putative heme-binding domain-containing protein